MNENSSKSLQEGAEYYEKRDKELAKKIASFEILFAKREEKIKKL